MGTEGFKRKITAIMSADAVGYSKLMGDVLRRQPFRHWRRIRA